MSYELEALARWVAAPIEGRRPPDLAFTAGPAREVADHVRALELQIEDKDKDRTMLRNVLRRTEDDLEAARRLIGRMQNALEDIITKTVTAHDGGAILPIREMAQRGLGLTEKPIGLTEGAVEYSDSTQIMDAEKRKDEPGWNQKSHVGEAVAQLSGCGHTVKVKDVLCPICGV